MVRRHYLVTGRVQGVGFRYFVKTKAVALGVKGRVRNLEDGRVEVMAQANEDALRAFEAEIAQGPPASKVLDLAKREVAAGNDPRIETGFEIAEDGEKPWTFLGAP